MIVHIITGLARGGAEAALFRLVSEQHPRIKTRIVSLTDGGIYQARFEAMGIPVECLELSMRAPSPLKWLRLVYLLRRWRPALVQTWMYHADLLGGVAAWMIDLPVVWGIRQTEFSESGAKRLSRAIARVCALLSSAIPDAAISCSKKAAQVHVARGYACDVWVVANGVDANVWRPTATLHQGAVESSVIAQDSFVFAHAGRADIVKGHGTLARGFTLANEVVPRLRIVLCGQGLVRGDEYFEALPFGKKAASRVTALGARDDLPQLWSAADAFVLSSDSEAFPNVVAEAMACGLPCIVTDVGDAAEIVADTGFVVPPGDPAALAEAMIRLANLEPEMRRAMGEAARARVEENYTLARMAEGFEDVWRRVLRERGVECVDW